MKKFIVIFMLMFSFAGLVNAKTMYIQSMRAKIVDKPTFRAKTIMPLKKGDQIKVIQTKGRWLKVSIKGKQGWISKFLVASHPPVKKLMFWVDEIRL